METLLNRLLVVDLELPEASGLRVVRDGEVGLQPHRALDRKRVGDLGGSLARSGRKTLITLEQDLKEHLCVESERRRVERNGLAVVDESIGAGDGVRGQKTDELGGREASVFHAGEDFGDRVLGLRDETERSGVRRVRAASHELEARSTWAVGDGHSAGKLDQVTSGDGELLQKGLQVVNGIVDSVVRA